MVSDTNLPNSVVYDADIPRRNTVALLVNRFRGARYASYPTFSEANSAWADAKRRDMIGPGSSDTIRLPTTPHKLNPPPYCKERKPKTPAQQEDPSVVQTPIKIEETTPRLPRTGSVHPAGISSLTGADPGVRPDLPTASPLAGYSRPPTTDVLMSYQSAHNSWWVVIVGNERGVYRDR